MSKLVELAKLQSNIVGKLNRLHRELRRIENQIRILEAARKEARELLASSGQQRTPAVLEDHNDNL